MGLTLVTENLTSSFISRSTTLWPPSPKPPMTACSSGWWAVSTPPCTPLCLVSTSSVSWTSPASKSLRYKGNKNRHAQKPSNPANVQDFPMMPNVKIMMHNHYNKSPKHPKLSSAQETSAFQITKSIFSFGVTHLVDARLLPVSVLK